MDRKVLAFDFGASSGRAIIFSYGSEKLKAREISRFPTRSEERGGVLWWDCEAMFSAVDESVKTALKEGIDSVGIDTWGCDFALVDDEKVVLPPLHYRDKNVWELPIAPKKSCRSTNFTPRRAFRSWTSIPYTGLMFWTRWRPAGANAAYAPL